jgi:hypothetical protein
MMGVGYFLKGDSIFDIFPLWLENPPLLLLLSDMLDLSSSESSTSSRIYNCSF